ncbi:hypothetical protein OAQ85_00490 [Schleiferiaceae bacterium]|jgi:hypothetical protein|nr:hypothetical protein [Flavobacteriales bacterium]MDC1021890.1 hypothetical protein [Schleiferiaceae bacterium]|tara:strand:- start:6051 stop:6920 length:870 start_codon:yes stop_codon:yes gene_type:complete
MKRTLFLLYSVLIVLSLKSCDTAPAPEVAYLKVDSLTVNALIGQGTSSSNINTFWIEQNGSQIGAFIPPCDVPVLAGQNQEIRIIPGISINGSYTQRNQYEMLNAKVFNWNLAPYSTRTLTANQQTFEYNDNFTIRVIEDFDAVGLNFNNAIQSDTSIQIINDALGSFQHPGETPNSSGKVTLLPTTIAEFRTPEAFELPKGGANVWLEVNYQTDIPLTFGVIANEQFQSIQAPVVTLFSNTEWNKVYLNLVTEVSGYPNAGDYNLFFGAVNNTNDTASILIDNIKLLY